MEEGKKSKRKLTMKRNRQSTSGRRDRLSELPDSVLLHIMEFMDTRNAVQTSVLSKRWRDLWKRLTCLSFFNPITFGRSGKFVSRVLSSREHSISLLKVHFEAFDSMAKLLRKVMNYAVSHNVQELTIYIDFLYLDIPSSELPISSFIPSLFFCPSLTSLKLTSGTLGHALELPKSLHLPALKTLYLINVCFTATNNDRAEPFSTCYLLNTLVLKFCCMHSDAKVLCISNPNLSSLNLETYPEFVVLSTPNLASLTIEDGYRSTFLKLSSTCDLSFLKEANIDTGPDVDYSIILSWLQRITNVKILTLSLGIIKAILNDLSNLATTRTQPPCFGRLESLNVKMNPYMKISKEEVKRTVEYLLQNSPRTRVDVINC